MQELVEAEKRYAALDDVGADDMRRMKRFGFSDRQLGDAARRDRERRCATRRWALGVRPGVQDGRHLCRRVSVGDAVSVRQLRRGERSAAQRDASPSSFSAAARTASGRAWSSTTAACAPSMALREQRIRDDHDQLESRDRLDRLRHSDKLYFEPLTLEDVLEIVRARAAGRRDRAARRSDAAQAHARARGGGRDDSRHVARLDRHRGGPPALRADRARARARAAAERHGDERRGGARQSPSASAIPVLVRPSYVLGGRAMQIVYDAASLRALLRDAPRACPRSGPCSIDRFLEDAFEADVDAISDGKHVVIGGMMQHIEDAGIHSGDSACVLPPYLIGEKRHETMREQTDRAGEGARRRRADQRAVRDQGRRRVRARGESARQPHDSVRVEGDRRAARVARGARDDAARRSRRSASPKRSCRRTCR